MSMVGRLVGAYNGQQRVDVGLVTGQQLRGTVSQIEESSDDLSDCATILLTPSPGDTGFAIAVPHIIYVRLVDEANTSMVPSIPPAARRM